MASDICEVCFRVFEHTGVASDFVQCDGAAALEPGRGGGHYEALLTAGWRPAYVRVYRHDHMPESAAAFSRSGWLCPRHASVLPDDLPGEPKPALPNPALLSIAVQLCAFTGGDLVGNDVAKRVAKRVREMYDALRCEFAEEVRT